MESEDAPLSSAVSVSDAVAARERPSWPEAVAIAQAVTARCRESHVRVPAVCDLTIDLSGAVWWQPAEASQSDSEKLRAAAHLLADLLAGSDAPTPLRQLPESILGPEASSQVVTLDGFAESLDYFARPDGARILARFAERADAALRAPERQQLLTELRDKARRSHEERPVVELPEADAGPSATVRLVRVIVMLTLLATVGVVVLGWAVGAPAPVSGSDSMPERARLVWVEGLRVLGLVPAVEEMVPDRDETPDDAPARRRAGQPRATASTDTADLPQESAVDEAPEPGLPAAPVGSAPAAARDERVYSDSDADVTPPRWKRQQLPSRAEVGLERESAAVLELLVLEDGSVSRVSLVGGSARVPSLMLLSAAKAWTFVPASRAGANVRYRLRIGLSN